MLSFASWGSASTTADRDLRRRRLGLARPVVGGVPCAFAHPADAPEQPSAGARDADPDLRLLAGRDREACPTQAHCRPGARAGPPPRGELRLARAVTDGRGRTAEPDRDRTARVGEPGRDQPDTCKCRRRRRRRSGLRGRQRRPGRSRSRLWGRGGGEGLVGALGGDAPVAGHEPVVVGRRAD